MLENWRYTQQGGSEARWRDCVSVRPKTFHYLRSALLQSLGCCVNGEISDLWTSVNIEGKGRAKLRAKLITNHETWSVGSATLFEYNQN